MLKFFEKEKPKSPRRRSPQRRRRSADDTLVSPENPYMAYYMDRFHIVREKKPDSPITEIASIISKEWNKLEESEKRRYVEAAKDARESKKSSSFFSKDKIETKSQEEGVDESKQGLPAAMHDNAPSTPASSSETSSKIDDLDKECVGGKNLTPKKKSIPSSPVTPQK